MSSMTLDHAQETYVCDPVKLYYGLSNTVKDQW